MGDPRNAGEVSESRIVTPETAMADMFTGLTMPTFAGHLGMLALHLGCVHKGIENWGVLVCFGLVYLAGCCAAWFWLIWQAGPRLLLDMSYTGVMRQFASPYIVIASSIEFMFCGIISSAFMGYVVYLGSTSLVFYHIWLAVALVQLILAPVGLVLYGGLWVIICVTGHVNYGALAILANPTLPLCVTSMINGTGVA